MPNDPLAKFQSLLRELFQFDCADLDFGIYRIMNHKREVVEKWIGETLPARVEAELRTGALRADSSTADRLDELKGQLLANFGANALDGDGNLAPPFHGTPLGTQYLELRAAAQHAISGGDQRAIVFNHLYQFFSHYYDSGDFISLRRYSARQKYAIPYNGEEVHLHWANADQYYIKTSEYFTDYRWKAPAPMGGGEYTVLFKLRNAEQETGNNKANEKRYFCFAPEGLEYDADGRTLTLPASYRALTPKEEKSVSGNGDKPQQMLIAAALAGVRDQALLAAHPSLKAAVLAPARNASGQIMVDAQTKESVPLLLKHLRSYAKRNNSDFFIHKDLAGFLTRELDFYLKNEVLSLDTLLAGGPRPSEGWFQLLHVIKTLGTDIITFLAQLENFQKSLFEKKKFVTDCHWCLTLDRVSASLLPEVAANPAQWTQWEDLHRISQIEPKTKTWAKGKDAEKAIAWLKTMPFLMVDTSLFKDSDFQDRVLATLPNIDDQMDGLLVNSENFQGLRLLQDRYCEAVKCIYVDPPYNTGTDINFPYKDGYARATWLSMITQSAHLAANLLDVDGLHLLQIGDDEAHASRFALEAVYPSRRNSVVVRRGVKNVQAQFDDTARLSLGHDVIHVMSRSATTRLPHLHHRLDEDKPGKWDTFWRGTDRETMRYELFGIKPKTGQWRWKKSRAEAAIENYRIYMERIACSKSLDDWWSENYLSGVDLDFLRKNDDGTVQYYVAPQGYRIVSDNWLDISSLGQETEFPHEKNIELLRRIVGWVTSKGGVALDYFAGSGTTGHATISLNREDQEKRKYILIEMGGYFDEILKKRLQRVAFAETRKDGAPHVLEKPVDPANPYHGISHAFKVIRLESYEDALANIEFTHETEGGLFTRQVGEEYLLKYALEFETQGSATRLSPESLLSPFDYRLNLFDGTETRVKPVDLPETFHYLIGLKVETRRWLERKVGKSKTHRYLHITGLANGDGKRVAILWRTVPKDWKEADYQAEKEWVRDMKIFDGTDRGWYNGPGTILGAHPLDAEFRRLLFA